MKYSIDMWQSKQVGYVEVRCFTVANMMLEAKFICTHIQLELSEGRMTHFMQFCLTMHFM